MRNVPFSPVDPDGLPTGAGAVMIPSGVAGLLAWERFASDPERVYELHQMRIAAKRLRYTLEVFAPCYPSGLQEFIERVRDVQEMLGDIHDADVLMPELQRAAVARLRPRREAAHGPSAEDLAAAAGLVRLCRAKREERARLHSEFVLLWSEVRAAGLFERLARELWLAAEPAPMPGSAPAAPAP